MRYPQHRHLSLPHPDGQIPLQRKRRPLPERINNPRRMDESVGGLNRILPLKRRINREDNRAFAAEVPGHNQHLEPTIRGMAAGDPLRDKDLSKRTVLILLIAMI